MKRFGKHGRIQNRAYFPKSALPADAPHQSRGFITLETARDDQQSGLRRKAAATGKVKYLFAENGYLRKICFTLPARD
ncbi:MAG TPA: hypothetical protein VK400_18855 [Pyrinomonadaceae bacterium]|nr:hypothetical protein [Pyrinomonadaceae bacterium]